MTLPLGLDLWSAAYMAAAFLIAAFVRGYSGFGFTALVVSFGSLIIDPRLLAPIAVLADMVLSAQMAPQARGHVNWRTAGWLSLGALAGVPLGIWFFTTVPVDIARAALAGIVALASLAMLRGWTLPSETAGAPMVTGTGVLSGIANTTGVGGLPVVVLLAALKMAPAVFRATLLVYFTAMDLITTVGFWWVGQIHTETFVGLAMAAPFIFVGTWAGSRHFLNADPGKFRRFAIGVLLVLAILGLIKAVL